MKTLLSLLLSASLLLASCTSYYAIDDTKTVHWRDLEGKRLRLTLHDGSDIESLAYQHVEITEPSHLLFGNGSILKQFRGGVVPFAGIIPWSSVDWTRDLTAGSDRVLRCWLRDSTVVTFREGEYIVITPDSGTGVWVRGERNGRAYSAMTPPDSIRGILVDNESHAGTILPILGGFFFVLSYFFVWSLAHS